MTSRQPSLTGMTSQLKAIQEVSKLKQKEIEEQSKYKKSQ